MWRAHQSSSGWVYTDRAVGENFLELERSVRLELQRCIVRLERLDSPVVGR
jgi:hypothetical protein